MFLVRHGQTVMNREVRFRGLRDVPLNDVGRAEARAAARALAESEIAAVYTSPLSRAREVARRIALACGVATVTDLPELVNLDYGDWEGCTKDECAERDPAAWALYAEDPEAAVCPGGEALASAADRVLAALHALGRRHPGEAVAAVTHGVMLRLAVLRVHGAPAGGWQFKIPTGSAIEFAVSPEKVELMRPLLLSTPDPFKDPTIRDTAPAANAATGAGQAVRPSLR